MNDELLVVGYGSLLSGHGLLTVRRNGKSRLIARRAFPVLLRNARRGLAKPSGHGDYLAMDLEQVDKRAPIEARAGSDAQAGEIGALGLVFERRWASMIARREEYDPNKLIELIALADRANQPLGQFLLEVAEQVGHDLLAYRSALFGLIGYTSPGYVFHPLPLADGRVAIVAIGSGFEGSGDPAKPSHRARYGLNRLLSLSEALALNNLSLDRKGQLGYFLECVLGGLHGLNVADLLEPLAGGDGLREQLAGLIAEAAANEHLHFLAATSMEPAHYAAAFTPASGSRMAAILDAGAAPRSASV